VKRGREERLTFSTCCSRALADSLQILGKGFHKLEAHHLLCRVGSGESGEREKESFYHTQGAGLTGHLFFTLGRTSMACFSFVTTGVRMIGLRFLCSVSVCISCRCLIAPCLGHPRPCQRKCCSKKKGEETFFTCSIISLRRVMACFRKRSKAPEVVCGNRAVRRREDDIRAVPCCREQIKLVHLSQYVNHHFFPIPEWWPPSVPPGIRM